MIRKTSAFVAALLLLSAACGAMAAGKLTVTEEAFFVVPYNDYYEGIIFAAITNTGNKPSQFNSSLLELFDKEGNSLSAESNSNCYPDVLQPGETGYIMEYSPVESAKTRDFIADHLLSVTGQGSITRTITAYPVSNARYEKAMEPGDNYKYVVCRVENNTDQVLYNITVLFVVRDAAGKLIYVTTYGLSRMGLLPHSAVEVRDSVDWEIEYYMKEANLEIAGVEAFAYKVAYK